MFDRNKQKEEIQIRVGDIIIVYNSKRIPHEMQPHMTFPDISEYNSKVSDNDREE